MFCQNCGAKNKKSATFCEDCGTKLEKEEEKEKQKNQKLSTQTNSSNKGKLITIISGCSLAFIIVILCVISSWFKPNNVVKKYMKAEISGDYRTLYKYEVNVENGDKTFTSFKAYRNIKDVTEYNKVVNYKVLNPDYDLGKLTATVKVNYTVEGSNSIKDLKIKLKKSNKKAFLIFDKWIISDSYTDSSVIKDYKLTVPKDSKVEYAGIKVDKKYLSEKDSSKNKDVYILSQVLPSKTPIKVTLKNGIETENSATPSTYSNGYKFYLNSDNISDTLKDKVNKQAINDLNDFYKGIIEKKEFSKLQNKNFDKKLEESYNTYSKKMDSLNYKLKMFEFTKFEIKRLNSNDDNTVRFVIYSSYKYQLDAENSKEKSTTRYIYLTYDISEKNYKLVSVESLPMYFYK